MLTHQQTPGTRMTNLLKETIEHIERSGHTLENITFIGSEETGHSCTWNEYSELADLEYDSGFGAQEVATDLVIVFSDGTQMWRHEYDGSEWWDYSKPFEMPSQLKPITTLCNGGMWEDLAEMNTPDTAAHEDG